MPIWELDIETRIAVAQLRWLAQWRAALLLLAVGVFAAGCAAEPLHSDRTNNAAVTVDLLFEHDGVAVYRFDDAGRFHYYAVPRSGARANSFSEWSEHCGKNCTRTITDEISTMAAR